MMNKIPKGWEVKKLGEIFNIVTGKTPSKKIREYFNGNIPFVKPSDLDLSDYIENSEDTLTQDGFKKAPFIPKNSVLVSCIGNLGKKAILKQNGSCNQQINAILPNSNFDMKFVFYYIDIIKPWMKQNASATTIPILNKSRFEQIPFIYPNLVEQKAIVDKLDDSFAKIENAITNLINAKENLKLYKQSVLKSAFNGDLLPSTSPTQRKKVKFEDVLKYEQPTKYIVKSTKYNNDFKTPVLTAGKGFILGYTDETEGIFTNTPVIIFDDFTTSSQYVNFHFKVKSSAMKILRPVDNVNLKFLFYKMQTIQHKSDTHKRYWISEYAKLEIPLPPLSEQNLIVAEIDRRFAIVDKTLNLIDKSIQNAKNLKQSILKKAFSGELRSEI
ncbi:restriction endonuclease subunit S [Campylobacter vicugnae]|uniref:restriction endonuclease subunit S n=1 Tax=Campylobacter vicugnae TaxID=1660076 RepID=UPI000A32FCD4|nr:restriction endonuclease subunit S [Campylobacter sp. S0112]